MLRVAGCGMEARRHAERPSPVRLPIREAKGEGSRCPLPRTASGDGDPGEAPEGEDPAEGQDDRAQEEPDIGSAVPRHSRRRDMDGDRSEGALPHGVVPQQLRCQRNVECNVLICLSTSVDEDEG